jgi:FlaA1/EpsC-like NDP-sugar epimerase
MAGLINWGNIKKFIIPETAGETQMNQQNPEMYSDYRNFASTYAGKNIIVSGGQGGVGQEVINGILNARTQAKDNRGMVGVLCKSESNM